MSAYSGPVLVPSVGTPRVLERVPLTGAESKAAYNEDWLQRLLYEYPRCLPVQELDGSFAELVPICREMRTHAGPVDVVFVTRDGRPVIVEAKLWRNPEARRKVIGQILDYAKELAAWGFGDLDAAVRQARQRAGEEPPKGLLELLCIDPNTPEAAHFHDSLTRNLRRGELLLLIAGDGIREGVGAITDFLEGHGTLHFTFGLIEIAIYRAPDGGHLVQPRILVQSDIVRRVVLDMRKGTVEEEGELDSEDPDSPVDNERARVLNAFWSGFLADLRLDNSDQPVGSAASGGNQFFRMPTGRNAWVSAFVARSDDRAGVYLAINKGAIGNRLNEAMLRDRHTIERDLGVPVEWKSDKSKHHITTSERFPGPILEVSLDEARRKLVDWTNRYVNTFRPRLEALARELT